MISSEYTRDLCARDAKTKILMLVIDGLGGLPHPDSEIRTETANAVDRLAAASSCGLISPLGGGLRLVAALLTSPFGYDPWKSEIGRGALSALVGVDFRPGDVASRLNYGG